MPASAKPLVTRATWSTETPFFISASSRSEATSSPPEMAMQPLSASCWHSCGREGLLEADVAPPADGQPAALQLVGQRLQRLGRRGLVDEVEAGLAGLGDDGLDAVDQHRRRWRLVARDVVQADVAEAALLPVAAVRHGELVPAPVAPQPVHGVEHVQQRQVAVQRQAVPGGRADVVEGHVGLGQVDVAHLRRLGSRTKVRTSRWPSAGPARCSSSASSGRSPASSVTKSK